MFTKHYVAQSFALCFVVTLVVIAVKSQPEIKKNISWDYFVYTQDWPPATCYDPETQKCKAPENPNIWTIHGLWPDRYDGKDVQFCNNTWKFDITELSSIRDQMNLKWPSLVGEKGSTQFWQHEWEKHGTCAAEHVNFNSILKYFSVAVNLHDQYNMVNLMKKAGFFPNTKTIIETDDLISQLSKAVGKNITIECAKVDDAPTSALSVVELYFDSNLQLIDSTKSGNLDCKKTLVYWPSTPSRTDL